MKYQGRIGLLFLSLLTSFIFLVMGDMQSPLFIAFSLFHAVALWIFGGWYDKYKFLSYHDPLTGVFNRRYAYNAFEKKFYQALKRNEKIGVLMIDINQFKTINDTYGHDYGDFILKKISRIIQKSLRKEDILVRWGGDEFLLLVINRDNADIERLVAQINDKIETTLGNCEEKNKFFPTLSMGYSLFPEDARKLNELISVADERMYDVKNKSKLKAGTT